MKLNETSLTPLYQQLMDNIKYSIENGTYTYDDKIPTEPELSEIYGVSRITVRRAVDELSNEGYLVKKQGKGTFVCKPRLARKIEGANGTLDFSKSCRENEIEPKARVLDYQVGLATPEEQNFFHVDKKAKILYIKRLLMADNTPIMIENTCYEFEKFKFLQDEILDNTSLLAVLERHGVYACKPIKTTLEIVKAEADYVEDLDIVVGEPLFYRTAYYKDKDGMPAFIGKQYMVGSRYKFVNI